MEASVAKCLEEAASEIGIDCKVDNLYSGRGMYGENTSAIILYEKQTIYQVIAIAAVRVKEDEDTDRGEDAEDVLSHEDFVTALGNIRTDTIGQYGVIYY